MALNYYYNSNAVPPDSQIVDSNWVAYYGGIDPATSTPAELAADGFYLYVPTPYPTFDAKLYTATFVWVITGTDASEDYTVVALPLPDAKANCTAYEQANATTATANIATASGYTGDVLTTTAALPALSRPAAIQDVFDAQSAVVTELVATIAAIDAATTTDQLNNIVNPPTGIINIGRGSVGPLDLNVSEYTEFNSTSMTESQTELYVPGTSTVINYGEFVPNKFDSAGNCFTTGDYLIQIREVATSRVIAEFECPLAPANVDVAF
jgi:hypothetical protein